MDFLACSLSHCSLAISAVCSRFTNPLSETVRLGIGVFRTFMSTMWMGPLEIFLLDIFFASFTYALVIDYEDPSQIAEISITKQRSPLKDQGPIFCHSATRFLPSRVPQLSVNMRKSPSPKSIVMTVGMVLEVILRKGPTHQMRFFLDFAAFSKGITLASNLHFPLMKVCWLRTAALKSMTGWRDIFGCPMVRLGPGWSLMTSSRSVLNLADFPRKRVVALRLCRRSEGSMTITRSKALQRKMS